jgi:hypothetical protein
MKITKEKLKQIVREELESLTVLSERKIKGKAVGNFLKKGRAGRTLTMQGKKYTDLGKGKWKDSDNKKLNWIELSSMASALGDEMVTLDENRALDNAIANRDANRAKDKSEFKEFQSLYFDMNNAIQKVSKNNKLKGYAGEVTHAVCDLLYFVEQDRLAIGEVFNALKRLRKKARDH